MSIDPALITTVQVSELPPNPLAPTNVFPHQVGDILSKATIQEFVNYIRSQSVSLPYETKILTIPQSEANDYINANFDMTIGETQGIGKTNGLWNGWAIHNGNNGTYNLDGQALIGYGANYGTIGQFLGSATHTLTANQIPSHSHFNGVSDDSTRVFPYGGTTTGVPGSADSSVQIETSVTPTHQGITSSIGGGQAHNNMQPSMVALMIYKLP